MCAGIIYWRCGWIVREKYLDRVFTKIEESLSAASDDRKWRECSCGSGDHGENYKKFLQDGVDVITLGIIHGIIEIFLNLLVMQKKNDSSGNFPEGTPGTGMVFVKVNAIELAVNQYASTLFMVDIDDPFRKMDELVAIARKRTPFIFVDFHGETTSEKQAMGWYLDGRVSAVVGTHHPTYKPMMPEFCHKERLICQM